MDTIREFDRTGRRTQRRRLLLVGGFVAAAVVAAAFLPLDDWLARSAGWIDTHPLGGRLAFVAVTVLLSALMVPGSLMMLCGGFLFGLLPALPLVSAGIGLGAGAGALVARTLAREALARRFRRDRRFVAIDRAVARRGFLIVLLSRLSLLMPFNLLNVIYGLSGIPLWKMTLASWLGMTPSVLLYTYLGSAASDVDAIFSGDVEGPAAPAILLSGLAMVGLVTWVIHRTATQALQRELADPSA